MINFVKFRRGTKDVEVAAHRVSQDIRQQSMLDQDLSPEQSKKLEEAVNILNEIKQRTARVQQLLAETEQLPQGSQRDPRQLRDRWRTG